MAKSHAHEHALPDHAGAAPARISARPNFPPTTANPDGSRKPSPPRGRLRKRRSAQAAPCRRGAGVCGLAGYQPPAPTPPPSPAAGTRASVDKAAVIDVLRQVAFSGSDRMRLEAFRLMLGAGKVLPPALLPQALELGRRTPSLRGPIALIAGERGRWLGGRNAAWNLFATNAENELAPEVWDNGTLMQREAYLKSLRAQDPAKARARFETDTASFDARELAAFTGCLGEG
ncbi:MAG: DUF5691 domain-containing protein, partial [Bilophila wadsworthia]